MGKVAFDLEANEAKAVQGFLKLVDAQKKGERGFRGVTRASKDSGKGMDALKGSLGAVAGALGVGGGIASAVALITKEIASWKGYMDGISELSKKMAPSVTSLGMMGVTHEQVKQITLSGATSGIPMTAAQNTAQTLIAQTGSFDKGLAAANVAWRMRWAGIPDVERGGAAISTGMGLGLSATKAARLIYGAGEASSLSPSEIAKYVPRGMPSWQGFGGGEALPYAVMADISRITKTEELGTQTKNVAIALMQHAKETGTKRPLTDLWESLGIESPIKTPMLAFKALADAGLTTSADLQKAGFGSQEMALPLSIITSSLDKPKGLQDKLESIVGQAGNQFLIAEKMRAMWREHPEAKHLYEVERGKALLDYKRGYGPYAGLARKIEGDERLRALDFEDRGVGAHVPQSGRVGATRGALNEVFEFGVEALRSPQGRMLLDIAGAGNAARLMLGDSHDVHVHNHLPPSRTLGEPYGAPQPTSGETSVSRLDDKDLN